MTAPIDGPPGYGQASTPTPGRETTIFTVLAAILGLGVGVTIAALIFSGGGAREVADGNDASAEYETEAFCTYTAVAATASAAERVDTNGAHMWRIYALANLANAASSGDPAFDDYRDYRGTDLIVAFSRAQAEGMDDGLEKLQAYCDARN